MADIELNFVGPDQRLAIGAATRAKQSEDSAALSSATAESAAGPTYDSVEDGLAATSDGEAFAVDNGDGTVTVYLNNGGVAVAQRTLATTEALASTDLGKGVDLVGNSARPAATRAIMAALEGSRLPVALLSEAGREGTFRWVPGDQSGSVSADPAQGIYVAPVSDASGSSGAWVRDYDGIVNAKWFGAGGSGLVDDSAAAQAAVDYVSAIGGGEVFFPGGIYNVDISVPAAVTITGVGSGQYQNNTDTAATILRRLAISPSAARVIAVTENSSTIRNLCVDGNGGRASGWGKGIVGTGSNYLTLSDVKLIDCDDGFDGNGTNPAGVVVFDRVVARQCNTGLRNFRDSYLIGCTISANYKIGIYCNQGQNRVLGGLIEWQRDQDNLTNGVPNAAHGVHLGPNAMEFIVDGVHFDRNAGNSIFIEHGARRITVGTACQFKGCGWGGDLPNAHRVPIRTNGRVDQLSLPDGVVCEVRNHGPSGVKGPYTPLGFASLGSSTRVNVGRINGDLGNMLDLNAHDFKWTPSTNGEDEYFLELASEAAVVSPIIEPDALSEGYDTPARGSAGSLSAGQWDWADNDGLGYLTVYLRTSGSADPANLTGELFAVYNVPTVNDAGVTDYQTPDWLDRSIVTVPAETTSASKLKTRGSQTSFGRSAYRLIIEGYQTGTARDGYYVLPFLLNRGSASPTISTVEGEVSTLKSGAPTFKAGWASAAADDILIEITAAPNGSEIKVSIQNTAAANAANLTLTLVKD